MKSTRAPLLGWLPAFLVVAMVAGMTGVTVAQDTAKLSYKAVQKWNYITPTESWSDASGKVGISHANGNGFTAQVEGHALVVDTTGNGKPNHKVKGVKGYAVLKAKDTEGNKFKYALRFKKAGTGWKYASSGVMKGSLKGSKVMLLDLNNNGVWNEFGTDGMIVGKGSSASLLSKVVNVGGNLLSIEVAENGRSITAKPFDGEVGTINLRKGFKSQGQLVSAVVSSESGNYSFELSGAKKGIKVPAGTYVLTSGMAKRGGSTVLMRTGRMKPLKVNAGEDSSLEWGAKVKAEFSYSRNGEKVSIEPGSLKYFGKAGIEFYQWNPDAKSPKFIIKDKKTGKEITTGRFGGC